MAPKRQAEASMGGQCMTTASFFTHFWGQFLDLQNAMKFGDVSEVLPSSKRKVHMVGPSGH